MSTIAMTILPTAVRSYLRRYALRRALQRIVRRAGLAIFFTLLWTLAWCMVDRAIALPAVVRIALLSINVAGIVYIVAPAVLRVVRIDYLHTAREIERREHDWRERLTTLASRLLGPARYSGSPQLLAALAADVETEASRRAPADLLPWPPALRPWSVSALTLALIASLAFVPALDLPRLAQRYFTPLAHVAPAATTRLFVTPGDVSIAAGETLRVRTSVQRLTTGVPTLHVRVISEQQHDWTEQLMTSTAQGAFEVRISNVERDIEYFVTGGDARSDIFRAVVLRRPAVVALRMTLVYPPYLKLPPRTVERPDRALEVPPETHVTFEIEASEPLSAAALLAGPELLATTSTPRPNVRRASFVAHQSQAITIRMTSAAGVDGEFAGVRIRVLPDRPPAVTFATIATAAPPDRIKYHAVDDFALSRIDAELRHGYGQQKVVALPLTGDVREQSGTLTLDAAALGLQAGEIVDAVLRVEDRAGQFTVSPPVRLSVAAAPTPPAADASPVEAQAVDPSGFSEPLGAYFQAISKPR